MQCSALRKNGHVVIKNRPCKIVDMSTSKTGKHGHAKVHLVAVDIFTNKKYEDLCPSTHNMNVPNVSRREFQLVSLELRARGNLLLTWFLQLDITDDGFLSLMTDNGDTKDDVKVPEGEIGEKINKLFKEDEKDTSKHTLQGIIPRSPLTFPPDVIILAAMGEESCIDAKEAPKGA